MLNSVLQYFSAHFNPIQSSCGHFCFSGHSHIRPIFHPVHGFRLNKPIQPAQLCLASRRHYSHFNSLQLYSAYRLKCYVYKNMFVFERNRGIHFLQLHATFFMPFSEPVRQFNILISFSLCLKFAILPQAICGSYEIVHRSIYCYNLGED